MSPDLDGHDPFDQDSDSDDEIELFEQERYSEITPQNVNSLRREVSTDSEFQPQNFHRDFGSRLGELTDFIQSDPFELYNTMFLAHICDITKGTNQLIHAHNVRHNLCPNDSEFVPFVNVTEMYNYYGLLGTVSLHKGEGVHTRTFINNDYKKKEAHLFREIGRDISHIDTISYQKYLEISRFLYVGNLPRYTDKQKWVPSRAACHAQYGGYYIPDIDETTGRPFQVLDLRYMFEDFLTNLNKTFVQFSSQESVFSIDEIMQLSKTSKNPFQQFNPGKRHKRGHAFRMLNCSFSRYCVKFSIIRPSY